jgi:uncharacterized coiled-coil protein SlyX
MKPNAAQLYERIPAEQAIRKFLYMNTLQLTLPSGLRRQILQFQAALAQSLAGADAGARELEREQAALRAGERELTARHAELESKAAHSDQAATELNGIQTRLQSLRRRLLELDNQTVGRKTVSLAEAGGLLEGVVAHYSENLVPAIASRLAPLCSQPQQAVAMARAAECVLILPSLRVRARDQWQTPATPGNVAWLNQIFDRALRGQPHLGFDSPEDQ